MIKNKNTKIKLFILNQQAYICTQTYINITPKHVRRHNFDRPPPVPWIRVPTIYVIINGKWAMPDSTAMPGQPLTRPEQAP